LKSAENLGVVPHPCSSPVAANGARASYRFLEFFTAQIRNLDDYACATIQLS